MDAGIWALAVPVISVVVVGIGIFIANSSKYFTIREQNAFNDRMQRELDGITRRLETTHYVTRDLIDDLRDRIKVIEQTRPTTGELQAALRQNKQTT